MDFIHKNYINPELECEGEVFKKQNQHHFSDVYSCRNPGCFAASTGEMFTFRDSGHHRIDQWWQAVVGWSCAAPVRQEALISVVFLQRSLLLVSQR